MSKHHRISALFVVFAALSSVACDKDKGEGLTIDLATSTMGKAKESYAKGQYEEAYETCKIVDRDALFKLKSDRGKAALEEYMTFCNGDVPDTQNKIALDKAYDEFKAALATDPSSAEWKKSGVESACLMAKPMGDTVSDRPTAKALAEAVRTKCSPEALTIKPAAAAAPAAGAAARPVNAKRK